MAAAQRKMPLTRSQQSALGFRMNGEQRTPNGFYTFGHSVFVFFQFEQKGSHRTVHHQMEHNGK